MHKRKMNTKDSTTTIESGLALAGSLLTASFVGASIQSATADDHTGKAIRSQPHRSVISLEAAAARGDPQAMYLIAMLHIEGAITDADYDLGVRLLKKSAAKGNKDAQRMYSFMDSAFSGEGC